MKHTKGPWKAVDIPYNGITDPCIVSETAKDIYGNEQYVAQTVYDMQSMTTRETVDADTILIAKAPEMYDQLASARAIMQKFVAFMDEYYSIRGVIEPVKSDSREDTLLKETYAEMKQWMEDE